MKSTRILEHNLNALRLHHPQIAASLHSVESSSKMEFRPSRKGPLVPLSILKQHPYPMHSLFDPVTEGRRLAGEVSEAYIIAFGMGGAYHLRPLMERSGTTGLIIIDRDLPMLKSILKHIDLSALLSDARILLLWEVLPQQILKTVLEHYLPILHGNLGTIKLRARWDSHPQWFAWQAEALQNLPKMLGRDFTVQSRFGCRWFINTIANLQRSEDIQTSFAPARGLLITAAGPSLQNQLSLIKQKHKDGTNLLATDTSVPALLSAGIKPDIVLSIDCQTVSYHHFFKKLPRKTLLLLDLASPPLLTRLTRNLMFFSSGHPFSRYISRYYRTFPLLDPGSGNVTHAALSFAQISGYREVQLFGADFSYPDGQPYAQGTYIYPYFQSRSNRLNGSEHQFWRFIASCRPEKEIDKRGWRWRNATMDHYAESLMTMASSMHCDFTAHIGNGLIIPASHNEKRGKESALKPLHIGSLHMNWKDFLQEYSLILSHLPPFTGQLAKYRANLNLKEHQAWLTLLPAAASLREEATDTSRDVEKARLWTIKRIQAIINNEHL